MNKARGVRCVGYVRSAVECGSKPDPLDAQTEQIRRRCGQFHLLDVLREPGRSARDMDRPQLKKLLRMVRRGRVDAVVVARLTALSRSVAQFDELLREFERNNVRLISVDDGVDTPLSKGISQIQAIRSLARALRAMDGRYARSA